MVYPLVVVQSAQVRTETLMLRIQQVLIHPKISRPEDNFKRIWNEELNVMKSSGEQR
jgi:hypothetical protein